MVGTVRRATVSLTPVIVFSSDLKSDTRPRSVLQPNSEQPNNEIVSLMSLQSLHSRSCYGCCIS